MMTRPAMHIAAPFAAALALFALCMGPAHAVGDPAYDAFVDGKYLTAIAEARKAAANGDPAAHTLLGEIYSGGFGVKRDLSEAAR